VGFGGKGVIVSLSGGDGTFTAPELRVKDFGFEQGWRVESHVRLLADTTGEKRADVVGFGAKGVAVARSLGKGKFAVPELAIGNFGSSGAAGAWRVDRHPRFLADITGDGRADIVGFGGAGVIEARRQTFATAILRADDLLDLRFEFPNLRLVERGAGSVLVRIDPAAGAFVIVKFAPQHVAEEAIPEPPGAPPPPAPPVRAVLAGPTRLVFEVPRKMEELPFALVDLLAWERLEPKRVPNALSATPTQLELDEVKPLEAPKDDETAIEAPYRVVLSPGPAGRWAHATKAVTASGRTELWHTRLASPAPKKGAPLDESAGAGRAVRAVWSPDRAAAPPPGLPVLPLTADDRRRFVRLSADFSQGHPEPIEAKRLMLTGLGAWLDLSATWEESAGTTEWRQRSTQGRDNYVLVTTPGFLCPWGNRAVHLEISERKLQPGPDGVLTAYLRKREFIVVKEPFKDYRPLADAYTHKGHENPFLSAHVLNEAMAIDPPPDPVFFAELNGARVLWSVVCEDRDEQRVELSMPLMFVSADAQDAAKTAASAYGGSEHRSIDAAGQQIAFAQARPRRTGEAALATESLVFAAQPAPGPAGLPFLPMIDSAAVRIPAVDALLGAKKPTAGTRIGFDEKYLAAGFDPAVNKADMFVRTLDAPLRVAFPAERSGGVARPNVDVGGLSRVLGAVGDAKQIAEGNFDVSKFFPDDATILGGMPLKALVAPLAGVFTARELPDLAGLGPDALWAKLGQAETHLKVPAFASRTLRDEAGVPTAVETQYAWKPSLMLKADPPFDFFESGPNARLVLATTLRAPLDGKPPTFESRGELSGFSLFFGGVIRVDLGRLGFVARSGRKLDVSAEGVKLTFLGALEFLQTIQDNIPADAFQDPPAISVTPEGISAGYSLTLPTIAIGVFSIENIALSASMTLPFVDSAAGVRFALSERHDPFLVSVAPFGGGGFFALAVHADGPLEVEASLEFGGNIALDLVVASGGVHVMAGIYFKMAGSEVALSGYLRAGGSLEVLGLITISAEFYMALTYDGHEVVGEASLTVGIEILFFSTHVTLHVERRFAGASGDPSFEQLVEPDDWATYCGAFAP
jgi:hypothetical protein